MVQPLVRTLLSGAKPPVMVPCMVTSLTPFEIDLGDGTAVPATKVGGFVYTLDSAIALVNSADLPVVLPIGV